MTRPRIPRLLLPVVTSAVVVVSLLVAPGMARAATTCGTSSGHTLCVTVPDAALAGPTPITVTNKTNKGTVIATWIPSGGAGISLIQKVAPSPETGDYSFVWPTQKYLDASGVLRIQAGSTSSAPVEVTVTLSNGNATDFQHSPSDWASYLPGPWTAPRDPVLAAVGDGPSDEPKSNGVAQSIAIAGPDLFLFLGDIYETGTFTENLNHYGQNSMDGGPGTLWGQLGTITQPTIGNHEAAANVTGWRDYFHQRPLYTSFRFGNVLFFDLASDGPSMSAGSAQYNYVKGILASTTDPPPPCIVTYFHRPTLSKDSISSSRLAMWTLLTDNGGDLVLNGHVHNMMQYKPLNDQLQLPSSGQPTMVQLVAGSGGHGLASAFTSDPRVEWSLGKTPGAIYLTLNGAASGGTATSLSWVYEGSDGTVLHTGTRSCGEAVTPPPSIAGFSPTSGPIGTQVTITGSGFTGATDVTFNGLSVGPGNFALDSDAQITTTVPAGATTGPISVTTPGGTATSSSYFTVASGVLTFAPDADTHVRADDPGKNFGSATSIQVDNDPMKHILLKFTVSGVGTSTIASVKLRLYCVDPSGSGGLFSAVGDNTWDENTVTWNTAPAAGNAVASLGPVALETWYEVDLTTFVTGEGTYSLRVTSPSTNGAHYSSKEGAAGFAPQLVVTLTG